MIIFNNAVLFDGGKISDKRFSLSVEDGIIKAIKEQDKSQNMQDLENAQIIDLEGNKILCPGFWDIHTHLRDPGQEWREDIDSGSAAGAAGGYVTLIAMPNTAPAVDTPSAVSYVSKKGAQAKGARVIPAGCVSKGRAGEDMCELLKMRTEGAAIFTDDGAPVKTANMMLMAMRYLQPYGIAIMEHAEDSSLFAKGQVHEGKISALSGLKGIPASCESIGVARAIELCREAQGRLHLTHLSSARSIEIVRRAKAEGLPVTADVTPHHLIFTEDDIIASGYDGYFKVNPPIRSYEDREALWAGLKDGTIDAIATDHAPWHEDEKDLPFGEASFGIASLECAAAGVLDAAARRAFPIEIILKALTSGPMGVILRKKEILKEGAAADITVIDMDLMQKVNAKSWKSKVRRSPWDGMALKGWPVFTMRDGRVIYDALGE